jgi:uncharacterized protein YacL
MEKDRNISHLEQQSLTRIIIGILVILSERKMKRLPMKVVVGGAIGLVLGLMLANLLLRAFFAGLFETLEAHFSVYILVNSAFGYLGFILGVRKGREFEPANLPWVSKGPAHGCNGPRRADAKNDRSGDGQPVMDADAPV